MDVRRGFKWGTQERRKYAVPTNGYEMTWFDSLVGSAPMLSRTERWPCELVDGDQRTPAEATVFRFTERSTDAGIKDYFAGKELTGSVTTASVARMQQKGVRVEYRDPHNRDLW